ncbi:MAG TPA: chorismate mutase [Bryobacteraceae bacterium]|nr:chorismate mutase [Bryobacteraceae bacterium]
MTIEEAWQLLENYRREIDGLDVEILRLLNARTAIVEKIGQVKEEMSMPIYEPRREDQVYGNVIAHNAGPLPPEAVKRLFERIIDEMRTLQHIRMQQRQAAASSGDLVD